jgi:phosphatidyl-myo-inositol dimannoside synthase
MIGPRQARVLAAVSLDGAGGGVAAVSRLLWRSMQDRWGAHAELVTALDTTGALTASRKLHFGSRAIARQLAGSARWILFSHFGLARVQALVPDRLECKYGVFLHGVEVWGDLSESDRRVLRRASLRVANSEYTATRVMSRHPDIGHVSVCPLALPPDALPPTVGATRAPIVLMVGRMDAGEAYKGHAEAIQAWPRVVRACPGARLVLAGSGDDLPRLNALAAQSGVRETITFTGFLPKPDLEDLYRRASVFLMPSRGEGFGIVYLEAMAHGIPCIGSKHDAAGDVIVEGVTGFLVDQNDQAEIAGRLVALLREPDRARQMGAAGAQRVHDVFTFDRFSARITDLIERALEATASQPVGRATTTHSLSSRQS